METVIVKRDILSFLSIVHYYIFKLYSSPLILQK